MPQGLQCFDTQGRLVVDLTDKHLTLFKQLTVQEAIGNQSVGQYFGPTDVGAELTLNGIHPDDTVAFITDNQVGTAMNTTGTLRDVAVVITAPNTYRMACMELGPRPETLLNFYKYR